MLRYGLPAIILSILSVQSAFAFEPVVIKEGVDHVRLGPQMDYLEDAKKQWSIEDVTQGPEADKFQPLAMAFPNFGFTRSAYWFRMKIVNATDKPIDLFLEQESSWINNIDLYIENPDGRYEHRQAGTNFPFEHREIKHNNFIFELVLNPGSTIRIYIKMETEAPFIAPLAIWTQEVYWKTTGKYGYYFGFFFGALLFALLYNLFLFFTLRDKVYLFYSSFVSSIFMLYFATEGLAFQYLWPDYPSHVNNASIFFSCIAWFSLLMFTRTFLDTVKYLPKTDMVLKALVWIYALLAPIELFNPDLPSTILIPFVFGQMVLIIILSSGILSLKAGNRAARFFLLGTTATFVGVMVNIFYSLGHTPANFFYYQAMAIGTLIDVILLSFALADRVKILREEKEAAQAAVIKSEKMAIETMAKAKDELEVKVEERTHELSREKERAELAKEQAELAKEEAEQANKLKDQFVTLVSHDLRAPLGNVMGMMEILQGKVKGVIKQADMFFLTRAMANCHSLMKMIDRLLDISRLRSGKMRVAKRFILTKYLLEDCLARLCFSASEKGIRIKIDLPAGHRILADEHLFGEVVQNIVGNAVKFLNDGDTVTIHAPEDETGVIVISDDGPGIRHDLLPHLFSAEKKTNTKGTKGEKGMGLGLPLCNDIMKAHGGQISVESREGDGATFRLTLPEAKATVLVVDDQEAARMEVVEQLQPMEVDVIEAANGIEALDRMAEAMPHLVITDILMPDMDGWELLEFIRKSAVMDGVPVIVFTSSDEIEARERAFRMGANDFVMKPIVSNDFVPRVQRFVKA